MLASIINYMKVVPIIKRSAWGHLTCLLDFSKEGKVGNRNGINLEIKEQDSLHVHTDQTGQLLLVLHTFVKIKYKIRSNYITNRSNYTTSRSNYTTKRSNYITNSSHNPHGGRGGRGEGVLTLPEVPFFLDPDLPAPALPCPHTQACCNQTSLSRCGESSDSRGSSTPQGGRRGWRRQSPQQSRTLLCLQYCRCARV